MSNYLRLGMLIVISLLTMWKDVIIIFGISLDTVNLLPVWHIQYVLMKYMLPWTCIKNMYYLSNL